MPLRDVFLAKSDKMWIPAAFHCFGGDSTVSPYRIDILAWQTQLSIGFRVSRQVFSWGSQFLICQDIISENIDIDLIIKCYEIGILNCIILASTSKLQFQSISIQFNHSFILSDDFFRHQSDSELGSSPDYSMPLH